MIRASDVGRYVYCARAWWLERVQGYEPTNVRALAHGTRSHDAHGRLVATWTRRANLAWWLLVLAMAMALVLALSFLRT